MVNVWIVPLLHSMNDIIPICKAAWIVPFATLPGRLFFFLPKMYLGHDFRNSRVKYQNFLLPYKQKPV